MQAYQGVSSDLSNRIRAFPRILAPSQPVPPADPTPQERRVFDVASRNYVTLMIEYYGEVMGRSQNLSKFYGQAQSRLASLSTSGVEPDAVKLVSLREETMGQQSDLFIEIGSLADLARTALMGRQDSNSLDELLTGVFDGAIAAAYAGFARGGEKDAEIGGIFGALRGANDVMSKGHAENDALADKVALAAAVATQLQRDIVECQTEHSRLATSLEAKYPDLDWSMMVPGL